MVTAETSPESSCRRPHARMRWSNVNTRAHTTAYFLSREKKTRNRMCLNTSYTCPLFESYFLLFLRGFLRNLSYFFHSFLHLFSLMASQINLFSSDQCKPIKYIEEKKNIRMFKGVIHVWILFLSLLIFLRELLNFVCNTSYCLFEWKPFLLVRCYYNLEVKSSCKIRERQ